MSINMLILKNSRYVLAKSQQFFNEMRHLFLQGNAVHFLFWGNEIISKMARQLWGIMLNVTSIMMRGISINLSGAVVISAPLLFIMLYLLLCLPSHTDFLSLSPVFLLSNKAYSLITSIIGHNAIVCFQMKAVEMRGWLTEKKIIWTR